MPVAIFAPYGRNDVTLAALRVAEMVIASGCEVRYVACGVHEKHVHPLWDASIRSTRGDGIYVAASKCDAVIHFQLNRSFFDMTKLVASGAKQIAALDWHGLRTDNHSLALEFDQLVCSGKSHHEAMQQSLFDGDVGREQLTWCRWDSGLMPVPREGTAESAKTRFLVYCDYAAIDYCGAMVLDLIDELLEIGTPRSKVTLASTKTWGKRDRAYIRKLLSHWHPRLAVVPCGDALNQIKLLHAHDWTILPSVRSSFGMMALRAMACGTAVIANDIPPFSESVTPEGSGLLVPCSQRVNNFGAVLASSQLAQWLAVCEPLLKTNRRLLDIQHHDWSLEANKKAFEKVWQRVLWD